MGHAGEEGTYALLFDVYEVDLAKMPTCKMSSKCVPIQEIEHLK